MMYNDCYLKIPPARPYCWSDIKIYNKGNFIKVCKQCGFKEECIKNIGSKKQK